MPKTLAKQVQGQAKQRLHTKLKKVAPKKPDTPLFYPCSVSNLPVQQNHGKNCYHLNCHQRYHSRGRDHLNDHSLIFNAIDKEHTDIIPFFWQKLLQEAAPATTSPRISEFSHILWHSFAHPASFSPSRNSAFTQAFHAGMLHPAITHPRQRPHDVFLLPHHRTLLSAPADLMAHATAHNQHHIVNLISLLIATPSSP